MLALLARRLELPYPIVFVVGGTLLAFVPHAPLIVLQPEWVFALILPPLLFSGGWSTDWKLFRTNLRPIGLLAIGLVIATTGAVAVTVHALLPQIGWASAFVLGAIVSPPDAVAASEVFQRFSVPRRIIAILEGEGLVNDATALVIYRFAVVAVTAGTFSPVVAAASFAFVAIGGVLGGLALGYLGAQLIRWAVRSTIADSLLTNLLFLVFPYAIYLSTDALGVSGVLATVVAGIFISRTASHEIDADSRLTATAVWQLLIFLLNGLVFLLIGLQIRTIVQDPAFVAHMWWIGAVISVLAIAVRIAWVFPSTYAPRRFSIRLRQRDPSPPWRYVAIIAWSGMRGIVSLAAALALPVSIPGGAAFPGRSEILFVTFCVIFTTLVIQGLSLIPLIRFLGIDGGDRKQEEIDARVAALRAGLKRLHKLEKHFGSVEEWEVQGRIIAEYEYRVSHLLGHVTRNHEETSEAGIDHRFQNEALAAERAEILRLRNAGEIPNEIFTRLQYDLDLADARLR